ncbi:YdcF family protein [Paenibacillus sp. H1-7]|uniref:YdcF family protein n=1 Tax=Paenibacillus sp. H1-7 TaxID=2282849 RepID=UPI001EF7763D|nr:YdcF family protein [Paenibacillus sp. H1-7]ULL18863.1 YdcF family protein [Paenibacillus sp. H1-7]
MKQKPQIPKEPEVPNLTQQQVDKLTAIVFLEQQEPVPCDAIFVFGGTHPGHWEKATKAYHAGLGKTIIVTGGVSPTAVRHSEWENAASPESHVIVSKLLQAGIPENAIVYEDRSRNTLENVKFARDVFDFSAIQSLLFICKAHGAGRQYRTLANYLPQTVHCIPYVFDTVYQNDLITRNNWMNLEKGRSRVYGEYIRICTYGDRGDIAALTEKIEGL